MQLEEITLGLFAACNSLRVLAYLPQIRKAAFDKNGASAISYTTWSLFLVAHVSTIAYAVVNRSDLWMASLFRRQCAVLPCHSRYRVVERPELRITAARCVFSDHLEHARDEYHHRSRALLMQRGSRKEAGMRAGGRKSSCVQRRCRQPVSPLWSVQRLLRPQLHHGSVGRSDARAAASRTHAQEVRAQTLHGQSEEF